MIYLKSVENAAAPGPLVEDNFEEIERTNTFERQPSKVLGVVTTNYGPPAGSAVLGQLWTDVGLHQWLCVFGGVAPKWRRISPNDLPVALGAGTSIDWKLGSSFARSVTAGVTFTWVSGRQNGMKIKVRLVVTGGPWAVTWPTGWEDFPVKWLGGVPATNVANGTHFYYFEADNDEVFARVELGYV